MILMPQIFDVTANENARYKRNELEYIFHGRTRERTDAGQRNRSCRYAMQAQRRQATRK